MSGKLNREPHVPVFLSLFALLGVLLLAVPESLAFDDTAKLKVGEEAVDFTTVDIDGNNIMLSDYVGKKVILLNFWALSCGACLDEMPHLIRLYPEVKDKVVFWGVEISGASSQRIKDTIASEPWKKRGLDKINYPLLLDEEWLLTDSYTNLMVPLTYIIDKNGKIAWTHSGFQEGDEKSLEAALRKQF